jgi:hypothetical protein
METVSYRFQITLNGRRHRRHYPNTVRQGRIRFKPIWDRYQTELFPILYKILGSEPHARIAAYVIYWLQFAKYSHKGRVGIFKEDKELQTATGKQSAGRLLRDLCRAPNSSEPPKSRSRRLKLTEPLFDVAYGPKPGQHSGRVRWIFETEASRKVLQEAREAREQKARTGRGKTSPPVSANCPDRSLQNGPTLISHTYSSTIQSTNISSPKSGEKMGELAGKSLQEVNRTVKLWNSCCEKSDKPDRRWTDADKTLFLPQLSDVVEAVETVKLSDEGLEQRLSILWGAARR